MFLRSYRSVLGSSLRCHACSAETCIQRVLSTHSRSREAFRGTTNRLLSFKIAIVGSGPSGCYTAKYLQSGLEKRGVSGNQVDVIERLPTPYGLVRYGVAPDHPEVKNVQNDFDNLFESHKINFYGNIFVGRDVSVQELRERYHAVVLAYGCDSDRKLGLEGEDLPGVLSAREFVAWYNGHPDFVHIGKQVAKAIGDGDKDGIREASVVVVGQGNVALDCARILAKGAKGLYDTDIAAHALSILGDGVSNITIVGRRGHIQGAFTIKELRELVKLEEEGFGASFIVRPDELDMGTTDASLQELDGAGGRPKKRIDKLLRDSAKKDHSDPALAKTIRLRFLLNPVKFEADESFSLGSVVCERTRLEGEAGSQKAAGTGEFETIEAQLVLVSIGYKGITLPGIEPWFDESQGVVNSNHGLVDSASSTLGGLYVSGWLKRGPTGIIGTNIGDAKDTVSTILHDLTTEASGQDKSGDIGSLLKERGLDVVRWEGYRRIEEKESATRRSVAQPREKITDIKLQLETALSS